MRIEAAHIDQIRRGSNGRMHVIDADVGGVANDLKRLDPHLKVRFAENGNPPYWCVLWESDDLRTTYLVTTVKAHQNKSGVWTGLDQRLVRRMQEIDPRRGYDVATQLERNNKRVYEQRRAKFRETVGETAELAAHALRRDLGTRYRGRTFVPRDIPA